MRRACASIALNLAEGMYSKGGNRIARFHDAMGSARETMACLHVCVAAEYLAETQVAVELEHLDHVIAGLYRHNDSSSQSVSPKSQSRHSTLIDAV